MSLASISGVSCENCMVCMLSLRKDQQLDTQHVEVPDAKVQTPSSALAPDMKTQRNSTATWGQEGIPSCKELIVSLLSNAVFPTGGTRRLGELK